MIIKEVKAREILNSRKEPTIEVVVNKKFVASAPSGASKGTHEVAAFTKGVTFSVDYINKARWLQGMRFEEFDDLSVLDKLIPLIGGNAVIAIQYALLKAMSDGNVWRFLNPYARSLPTPLGNVIGGGKHTKELSTDIQEFLLVPRSKRFYDRAFINNYLHKKIGKMLKAKNITDEGAWVTSLSNIEVLELLNNLLSSAEIDIKVELGVDMAATSIWNGKRYCYRNFSKTKKKTNLTSAEQVDFVNSIINEYNLCYVEDPLHEEDFSNFAKISKRALVCGDDLITTNLERLKKAVKHNSVNCIIIKPNQIGSVVKAKEVVDFAKKKDITTVISHRSGETMDATIAHLVVAWEIPYIKCGIFGKERQAKLNELVKIEEEIF